MKTSTAVCRLESSVVGRLEGLPVVGIYAKTRGWPFILSWAHRISGLLLIAFVWFHIYSLSSLYDPIRYNAKMAFLGFVFFAILEWLLVIPVVFHAFNGGRLILFELFGARDKEGMIRWVFCLTFIYTILMGLLMILGSQSVSPFFFWINALVIALFFAYAVGSRVWRTPHALLWKLQRMSGAFLLIMAPAHFLFMHLNPQMAKEAEFVIQRMQNVFIRGVDLLLLFSVMYHAAYGGYSVMRDYLDKPMLRIGLGILFVFVMLIFTWAGFRLTVTI